MSIQETVTKDMLIDKSEIEFQKAGYSIWRENINSNTFDFIASKSKLNNYNPTSQRIITKVLTDLDFFKKRTSIELQLISKLISGFPLLVAHSATGKNIEEATLYRRHDVSAISIKTLQLFLQYERGLETKKISKFAHRGGVLVNLSKERFKERRRRLKLDMTILAKKSGISRHSLYKYEKGKSFPKKQYFNILSQILGDNLDIPLNILETRFKSLCLDTLKDYKHPQSKLKKEVTNYLTEKGISVLWFKSEPFDALSESLKKIKGENSFHPIITGVTSSDEKNDFKRIFLIKSLSKFLQKKAIWFTDDNSEYQDSIMGFSSITTISISDLERMAFEDFEKLFNKKNRQKNIRKRKSN
ncbi:MAG: helix-turn-helix domain-containing protein [Candidatus Hodarchaeales archaeon]|jgi:predicted transcriptional regulator